MLAPLIGDICLLIGLSVLMLPIMATELSRPRDGVWGAVVLLLGLVLVTSGDRLRGAPMVGVICATLLICRLGVEVGRSRWNQLSDHEQQRLGSKERWSTSFAQLGAVMVRLFSSVATLLTLFQSRPKPGNSGKKWVRPEDTKPGKALPMKANQKDREASLTSIDNNLDEASAQATSPRSGTDEALLDSSCEDQSQATAESDCESETHED